MFGIIKHLNFINLKENCSQSYQNHFKCIKITTFQSYAIKGFMFHTDLIYKDLDFTFYFH